MVRVDGLVLSAFIHFSPASLSPAALLSYIQTNQGGSS
jgi:hypothetical protein